MKKLFPIITACMLTCITAGHAWGAWRQFIPRYVDFSGSVGTQGLYEENKTSSQDNTHKRSDLTIQEAISFDGLGYIYSPLFVSLQTSVSLGLEQERIRQDSGTETGYSDANQIKQVFKFLPAHPYNLEIYGMRRRPLQSGSWGGNSPVLYEYGGKAMYDLRPWAFTATYTEHETRSGSDTTSENDSFIFHSNYYDDFNGVTGSALYHHSTFDILNSTGNREMYGFNFVKLFESWRYTTNFNSDRQNQDNAPGSEIEATNFERQEWNNALHMDLPQNFNALITYAVTENNTSQQFKKDKTETFTDTERYAFKLRHRLYKSLSTSIGYNHNYNESSGGRTKQESYRLNASYTKKMRWGSILNSSWSTLSYLDNLGAPRRLFENQSISALPTAAEPVPYSFTLNFQQIDRGTITIFILDSINPPVNNRILLTEGLHYVVEERPGGLFRIIIQPPAVLDPGLGLSAPIGFREDYDYQADYAFIPSDYELRTTSWGNTLQVPLFNSLITPIYSYSETRQKEMDGEYPGIPDHSTSHTVGLAFQKTPFRADVSQNWFRSKINSTDRLSASLNYTQELSSFTTGFITLGYEDSNIKEEEEVGRDTELEETIYNVQCQLQTLWPQQNLTGTITGNYSIYDGTGDSTSMSFFSALMWRVGQLSLDLSASYTDSTSEFGSNRTDQSYTLVRFLLKRELF